MTLAGTGTVRCPLCGVTAQPDGACPDCGQDLAPLSHLQARPALRYNRALELAAQGDVDRAAAHLEALLADHGLADHGPADSRPGGEGLAAATRVDAWTVLGKLRARAGRGADARRALSTALAVRPDHEPARAAVAGLDAREAAEASADRAARRRRLLVPAAAALLVAGLATALVLSLVAPRAGVQQVGFLAVGTRGGLVELTGTVPDATARAVTGAARAAAGGRQVVDSVVADEHTAAPPGVDGAATQRLVAAVLETGAGDRGVVVSAGPTGGTRTVLTGTVPDEQAHRAVVAALGPPRPDAVLDDRLRVVGTPPAAGPAPGRGVDEIARLGAAVAAVQRVGPLLFPVGQVTLGPRARATVAAVAGLLVDANDVTVQVDGYAASASATARARAVSEQRAAAVRDALVAAGVDPARVTTRGLAGTNPRENAQNSRRVEIGVRPR